jgi:hypothetical protein
MQSERSKTVRVRADVNGLFGDILCLSHSNECITDDGETVKPSDGMDLLAYDEDTDANGKRDDLIASGVVESSPSWLKQRIPLGPQDRQEWCEESIRSLTRYSRIGSVEHVIVNGCAMTTDLQYD